MFFPILILAVFSLLALACVAAPFLLPMAQD